MREFKLLCSIFLVLLGVLSVNAQSVLEIDTVTTCDYNPQGIVLSRFDIKYYRDNQTIFVDIAGYNYMGIFYGTANMIAYAGGSPIFPFNVSLCDINVSQICPIPSGLFNVTTTIPAPPAFATQIPAVVFNLPLVATSLKLSITNDNATSTTSTEADLCVIAQFGNGNTLNLPAIGWTSAGVALFGIAFGSLKVVTAIMTGDINKALSAEYPSFTDLVAINQQAVFFGQLGLQYPKFFQEFTMNFAWAAGLVKIDFIENAINSARQKYGNFTDQYPLDTMRTHFDPKDFFAVEYLIPMQYDLSNTNVSSITNATIINANLTHVNFSNIAVPPNVTVNGLNAFVKELKIPSANVFMTILIFFLFALLILAVAMLLGYFFMKAFLSKFEKVKKVTTDYRHIYAGYTLQLIAFSYSYLLTYALFQFTLQDSMLPRACAGITVAVILLLLLVVSIQVLRTDSETRHTDNKYLYRYGFLYKEYRKESYIYFVPLIIYTALKACLVGLAGSAPLAQAIGNIVAEAFLLVFLVWLRPYETKRQNFLNILVNFLQTVNALLAYFIAVETNAEKSAIIGIVLLAFQAHNIAAIHAIFLYNTVYSVLKLIKLNKEEEEKKKGEKGDGKEDDGKDADIEKGNGKGSTDELNEKTDPEDSNGKRRPQSSKPPPRQASAETGRARPQSAPPASPLGKLFGRHKSNDPPAEKDLGDTDNLGAHEGNDDPADPTDKDLEISESKDPKAEN